jgi:hypothetical protein
MDGAAPPQIRQKALRMGIVTQAIGMLPCADKFDAHP